MNQLTQRFDSAYRRIEHQLKVICESDQYLAFYKLIEMAAKASPAVRQSERLLRTFGNLRNVLVHDKLEMAVPNEQTVLKIEAIANTLENPPKLVQLFSMKVETCSLMDSVGKAARTMHDMCFSQLPVLDGNRVVGLLTAETIARWLATRLQADGILEGEPVEAVLKHQELDSTYKFHSREASVFDGLASFDEALHGGNDLDAILLTHSGSKTESLLGIVTPADIPHLIREAQLNTV